PDTDDEDGDTDGLDVPDGDPAEMRALEFDIHLSRAQRFEREGRVDEAIREYSSALKLQRGDPGALRGRAHLHYTKPKRRSCPRRAIADLKMLRTYDPRGLWLEERANVFAWMAECGERYQDERLNLAVEMAEEDPETPGRPDDIRFTLAKLRLERAESLGSTREAQALRDEAIGDIERYREECTRDGRTPQAEALSRLAGSYQDRGETAKAISVYTQLISAYPGHPLSQRARKAVEDLQLELELATIEKEQGGRPTPEAQASFDRAVEAIKRNDLVTAESELQRTIKDSPWFQRARYVQGLVYARQERFADAVHELRMAIRLDRFDYEAHMRLGLIYAKRLSPTEDRAAIEHLEKALELRPDLHQLRLFLGELYARTNRERARVHYRRFLEEVSSDHPDYARAAEALRNLDFRLREEEPAIPLAPPSDLRRLEPELQRMINEAYLRVGDDGDWSQADKILRRALKKFPGEVVVLNELAKVASADNRPGDARSFWERSLQLKEDQREVHERLGLLLRKELPDEALPHLQRAAELGSTIGRFLVAQLLLEKYRLVGASEQLDLYFQEASDFDLHWDVALELRDDLDAWFLQIYILASALGLLLISLPALRIYRRFRGASLSQLLERAPTSFPEIARILSLIRHEILKHNTAFLSDVGHALEVDEPGAENRASIVARRLFGEPSRRRRGRGRASAERERSTRDQGIYGRFLGYVDELEKVARSHGVTLNLHRKDPIFREMIRAFESLRGLSELQHNASASRKLDWSKRLLRCGQILGRDAFERLSSLIRSLCIVRVDRETLQEVHALVVTESQFAGVEVAAPEVTGEGAAIRVFRTDLDDILTNVIRNSLHSSVLYAPKPIRLGVELINEMDEITGLTTLAIRIKDQSTEKLSNEMLRGRYVERGMGITADLLSRYDGSIAVEPEQGWQKAVVLRFFTVEEEEA
ncbi:MAG: tetratricopeptide repeat protein, partial [Myxococcales bacterium]|nr:tetratricopeptide repeat protein [Myxococcales bacterium]